jgi:ArsR family transcriptional regulator
MKTHFKESFLENSTETLRAIAHPIRIAILDLLYKNGQMTVTDIYTRLNIEQAIASHHLRILKNKNVVVVQRDGKNSLYSLATKDFYDIVETLTKVL